MQSIHYYDFRTIDDIHTKLDTSLQGSPTQRSDDGVYYVPFRHPIAFCVPSGADSRIELYRRRDKPHASEIRSYELKLTSTLVEPDHFVLLDFFRALDGMCITTVLDKWFTWKGKQHDHSLDHAITCAYQPVAGECITDSIGSASSFRIPGVPHSHARETLKYSCIFHATPAEVFELKQLASESNFHEKYYKQFRVAGIEITKKQYRLRIELNALIASSDLFLDSSSSLDEDVVSHYDSISTANISLGGGSKAAPHSQEQQPQLTTSPYFATPPEQEPVPVSQPPSYTQEQEHHQEPPVPAATEEDTVSPPEEKLAYTSQEEQPQPQEEQPQPQPQEEQPQPQPQEEQPQPQPHEEQPQQQHLNETSTQSSSSSSSSTTAAAPAASVPMSAISSLREQFYQFEADMKEKLSQLGKTLFF
jgi:hypothetical protein